MPWNHMNWNPSWHSGYLGFIGIILLLAVLVMLVPGIRGSNRRINSSSDSPEDILKRRYAQGKIGKAEYDRMLGDLHH